MLMLNLDTLLRTQATQKGVEETGPALYRAWLANYAAQCTPAQIVGPVTDSDLKLLIGHENSHRWPSFWLWSASILGRRLTVAWTL